MTIELEECLARSKRLADVRRLMLESEPFDVEAVHVELLRRKASPRNPRFRSHVEPNLRACLLELNGSNYAHRDAEERRLTPFESGNVEHEKMLVELWTLLRPGVQLEDRYTRQWGDIGFQGRHPSSDFRGMGMLGLHHMLFLAREHTVRAQGLVVDTMRDNGYPFAITSINVTSFALHLLQRRALSAHFVRTSPESAFGDFAQVYARLMLAFHTRWMEEEPENVLAFPSVFARFRKDAESSISLGELPAWVGLS
eukprot:CAMPEP_0196779736 /NCGR_PEP_ID=MMETSP1104-20130614/6556_1 /TAXON_ID=33652 /ORGANISM="Cafeteria sp., Strain Caron Lab Isolate" /LENGTH=254 /DNA_ID=CAMNT_0042149919 /DNA_START=196 /DNA_END=960 /DNA_ORIENTATION=+